MSKKPRAPDEILDAEISEPASSGARGTPPPAAQRPGGWQALLQQMVQPALQKVADHAIQAGLGEAQRLIDGGVDLARDFIDGEPEPKKPSKKRKRRLRR